jgi:hypothetical protein
VSCVQAGAHVCDVVGDQAINLMESNASLEAEFASTSIKPENEGSFFLCRIDHSGALLRVILTHLGRKVSDQTRSSSRMLPSVIGGLPKHQLMLVTRSFG